MISFAVLGPVTAADDLAARHELGLVGVFTQWYRVLRADEAGHRAATARLDRAGMPGMRDGLLTVGPVAEQLAAVESPGCRRFLINCRVAPMYRGIRPGRRRR